MDKVEVTILEPKVRRVLEALESLKLIEIGRKKSVDAPKRRFGSLKGLVVGIADDFDAPLEDFEEYM